MQGVFVGTFLIGLREGLEATLIVSIVAAFLKRNGRSMRPMFAGVGLAVLISIAVGVGLELLSSTLPQRQQEMMETVIGAIAVVFVTSMIIWMNRNAGRLKGELEREAQEAVNARRFAGAGRDGLPRGAQGGLRDGGVPAGGRPDVTRQPLVGGSRRRDGDRGGDRPRHRPVLRRPETQPRPLLPRHRCVPGPDRRRAGDECAADRPRGGLGDHRAATGLRPVVLDSRAGPCGAR